MEEKILKIQDIIQQNADSCSEKNKVQVTENRNKKNIPRGTPKSGRKWKCKKNRFSSIIMTPGYKKANKFEKLQNLKKDLNRMRQLTRSIVEKHKEEREKKKERRRINIKRQEENRLKSEVVQVIKNSAKIKRMKKKQLRKIEKRDTLKLNSP